MKLLKFLIPLLLFASSAWSQDVGGPYFRPDCITLTPVNNSTLCYQQTTAGGRTAGVLYSYTGNAWVATSSTGSGDVTDVLGTAAEITSTNSSGPAPTLSIADSFRITGHAATAPVKIGTVAPGTCTIGDLFYDTDAVAGSNLYGCTALNTWTLLGGTTAAASSVTFAPNGSIAAVNVQTAVQEVRDEAQPVDGDLTAIAALSGTGFLAHTAANTWFERQIAAVSANNILITNPAGVAGNLTVDVGPNVALTTRGFTIGNFDFDLGAAASFTMPKATGGTTTVEGRIITNTTTHRAIFGNGTSAKVFAFTDEIQPLSAILTGISTLTPAGTEARIPYVDSAGVWHYWQRVLCVNAGGNVTHTTSLVPLTESCDAGASSGLSGATNNQALFATAATTFASSADLTRSAGGVIQMPNGIEVGDVSTNYWDINATAITGHKTLTLLNLSGTIRPSTGAFTNGNIVKTDASGFLVDGGAAGTGDVTLVGVQELTHKTIKATGYSTGDNTVNLPIVASFDGGGLTADGTNCQDPVKVTINSGPTQYAILCATPNSAIIDAVIIGIKQAVTTLKVRLKANDTANTKTLDGTFKAQCRASGTLPSATWGTTQAVSITLTNLNTTYQGLTAAITPNGTCSLGSDLYIRYNATGGANSATTRILGLTIEQDS